MDKKTEILLKVQAALVNSNKLELAEELENLKQELYKEAEITNKLLYSGGYVKDADGNDLCIGDYVYYVQGNRIRYGKVIYDEKKGLCFRYLNSRSDPNSLYGLMECNEVYKITDEDDCVIAVITSKTEAADQKFPVIMCIDRAADVLFCSDEKNRNYGLNEISYFALEYNDD